jgi:hypothetical protein
MIDALYDFGWVEEELGWVVDQPCLCEENERVDNPIYSKKKKQKKGQKRASRTNSVEIRPAVPQPCCRASSVRARKRPAVPSGLHPCRRAVSKVDGEPVDRPGTARIRNVPNGPCRWRAVPGRAGPFDQLYYL